MRDQIAVACQQAAKELYDIETAVVLTCPEEQHGDYTTNIALQLARPLQTSPRDIADALCVKLQASLGSIVSAVEAAGPGFINLRLNDKALLEVMTVAPAQRLEGQTIVAEYSDPNPFKILHAGHLYTSVIGDAVANLLQAAGAQVHRVNFGGDVGLHVAKTIWAIMEQLGGENPQKLAAIKPSDRAQWMADCYVTGTNTYDDDEVARAAMTSLNKQIYQIQGDADHTSQLAQIYWTCRDWSYQYFDEFYASIGSGFEKYYPESSVAELGLQTVKEQQAKGIFVESDGAVVFKGEPYGLHTRVFINSQGLPTYEAKDIGLVIQKYNDYHFDRSVVITANEIDQYMAVVLKALDQFRPELVTATTHKTHGLVKLAGGVKMSSRRGNILRASDVLDAAARANQEVTSQTNHITTLGAIKYAFLKQRLGADIIYDPKESVAILGNTGPYLQYAHARAQSIIKKADQKIIDNLEVHELTEGERSLVRKLGAFNDAFELALTELLPHHLCSYLYELAQTFNRFYEHNRVVGNERQAIRLYLVQQYITKLASGLQILGIEAPDQL